MSNFCPSHLLSASRCCAARAAMMAIFLAATTGARALATRRLVGMVAPPTPRRVSPVATSNATAPVPATTNPGQIGWGAGAERLLSTRQHRVTAIKP